MCNSKTFFLKNLLVRPIVFQCSSACDIQNKLYVPSCYFELLSQNNTRESDSRIAIVCLSVSPSSKPLSLSELLLSTIEPINHRAYRAYWPSSLLTINPINLLACFYRICINKTITYCKCFLISHVLCCPIISNLGRVCPLLEIRPGTVDGDKNSLSLLNWMKHCEMLLLTTMHFFNFLTKSEKLGMSLHLKTML